MENLISIKNLSVGFQSQNIKSNVVKSISFEIPKGKTVALVGESGSGKTVTALSILKLLPYPSAFHDSGEIIYNNIDILKSKQKEIQKQEEELLRQKSTLTPEAFSDRKNTFEKKVIEFNKGSQSKRRALALSLIHI